MLRVVACGSVDDGKSTLIGRLLHDSRALREDELALLARESRVTGTQRTAIDYALLTDGLAAEREQGITIDVAYRYFAGDRRNFILADTPGHERYTRNMVTGASTAQAGIVIADVRKGLTTQTRRHTRLLHLLGVRRVVLAVNKLDLVGFDEARYRAIAEAYRDFAAAIGLGEVDTVPIAALAGDNVVARSARTPWFDGATIAEWLDTVLIDDHRSGGSFAMPVQWVARSSMEFRGFAGRVVRGSAAPGAEIAVLPSGERSRIARIVAMDGDLSNAAAGQSVMITLTDEVPCARGDSIAAADEPPQVADQFEATLVWFDDAALVPGRSYLLQSGPQRVGATIQPPKYRLDVERGDRLAASTLQRNDIGVVEIATDRPMVFAPYAEDRSLGGGILIDRATHATAGMVLLHFALRRSQNVHWQGTDITPAARAALMQQRPRVIWFTGLSGAGKSTIANLVEARLHAHGRHTALLDGDNVRHGLSRDLGFDDADRIENLRRVGEVARLMTDAGLIVLVAFISPFAAERAAARALFPPGTFVEVHVAATLADVEARDVKGLYRKARAGNLSNFTGIDSPYEPPEHPELRIDTARVTAQAAADEIVAYLMDSEA